MLPQVAPYEKNPASTATTNADETAREQAAFDRGVAVNVHEGGPAPDPHALEELEAAARGRRVRRASLLRQREVLAAEHRNAEVSALQAERESAAAEQVEFQRAIDALTAQIAALDRERGDLRHRAGWWDMHRRPALDRRLGELRRPAQ
jgi:hypothetical protein